MQTVNCLRFPEIIEIYEAFSSKDSSHSIPGFYVTVQTTAGIFYPQDIKIRYKHMMKNRHIGKDHFLHSAC